MAIKKIPCNPNFDGPAEDLFAGRVIRLQETVETRNHSDTMDYTDHRSTTCTYALVWLGTHGVPPSKQYTGRATSQIRVSSYDQDKARSLEFFEQFAWIDCTNLFSDRYGFYLKAEVDVTSLNGEPMMLANLIAWEAYEKSVLEKLAREARAAEMAAEVERQAREAKQAAKDAKKLAKANAGKAAAEALLARCPAKGMQVTVDGFTGTITWMGVKSYYGKWNARLGVKNAQGAMIWVDAQKIVA